MLLEMKERKMDLKNHEPSFLALILIIIWLVMIVTIFVYL